MEHNIKGVYSILCKANGMRYFGSSMRCVKNRYSWHRSQLKNGKHNNPELQLDYDKYGIEEFEYHIEFISDNKLEVHTEEQFLISQWECYNYFFNDQADFSERNKKIAKGHSKVRKTVEWKQMQSELTSRQHEEGKFPCYHNKGV